MKYFKSFFFIIYFFLGFTWAQDSAHTAFVLQKNISVNFKLNGNYFEYQSYLATPAFWILAIVIAISGFLFFTAMLQWNRALTRKVQQRTGELSRTIAQLQNEIDERVKAEEALRESERRYRYLFEDSPAGSLILDENGLIRDVNKSFEHSLGYARADIIGKHALDFIVPEKKEYVEAMIDSRFHGDTDSNEIDTEVIALDGSVHYVTLTFGGGQALLYNNGKLEGILIAGIDVTERRKAEMLAKQQQQNLIQADKMATLGILVSGVAHEINNPNNFIILNSDNLADIWKDIRPILDKYKDQHGEFMLAGLYFTEIRDEVGMLISGISDGALRIRNIVQNLKDFSRQEESGEMDQPVQVNAVISAAVVILGNLIKKSTESFTFTQGENIPCITGAFQKIEQVVINLITNACQALTDKSQAVIVATSYNAEAGRVVIEVRDQGTGISPENLKQIMNPFFTTKRDTGGTGLGLSISYNIVKDHGGELTIESDLGCGTVVTVTLPVSRENEKIQNVN